MQAPHLQGGPAHLAGMVPAGHSGAGELRRRNPNPPINSVVVIAVLIAVLLLRLLQRRWVGLLWIRRRRWGAPWQAWGNQVRPAGGGAAGAGQKKLSEKEPWYSVSVGAHAAAKFRFIWVFK